ncbi:MAG TPA: GH25 family lysozyme [Flavobacterium sp.]|nr:GH25 family lysozyme [Flavobacterium sp.]
MKPKHYLFASFIIAGVLTSVALSNKKASPQFKNTDTITGIDISHFQGDEIDYLTKKGTQLEFVICKATEGITYTDPDFKNNWNMIKQQGFVRGAYHFYHCADDPTQQANNYLAAIGNLSSTDFPPIVDFEENSIDQGCSKSTIQKNLLQFLTILEQKTGKKPILYTDTNIGNSEINDPSFANYPLWIADYNPGNTPTVPSVWKNVSWTLWQKTESYSLDTYTNDFDVFNGDSAAFAKVILGN